MQSPLDVKTVCIKTIKPSLIHEKFSILVQGIHYELVVRELSNWERDIVLNEDELDRDMPKFFGDYDNNDMLFENNEGDCTTGGINQEKDDEIEEAIFFQTSRLKKKVFLVGMPSIGPPIVDHFLTLDYIVPSLTVIGASLSPPNVLPVKAAVQINGVDGEQPECLYQPPGFHHDHNSTPDRIMLRLTPQVLTNLLNF
ncbi:unnamed protein product [Lactuca saligna]|uniref:Uncharacterized protein n=1 Tax=Lactuca saligna TaxID=75948 RepID=A0AA35YK55_LACSI|nr:unnamed protein product [Lactuca saligna]